jgi:parallel beta-helix repeat protein
MILTNSFLGRLLTNFANASAPPEGGESFSPRLIRIARRQARMASSTKSQALQVARNALGPEEPFDFLTMARARNHLTAHFERKQALPTPELREAPLIAGQQNFTLRFSGSVPLVFEDCENFCIDLSNAHTADAPAPRPKFNLVFRRCRNFALKGGSFHNTRNFALFERCEDFSVTGLALNQTEGYGLTIFNSRQFLVSHCMHIGSLASGVYCLGESAHGLIRDNVHVDGKGHFNWDAAIHINHCSESLSANDLPERSHEPLSILGKTLKPSYIFIERNILNRNRAQGIYCEGALQCVIEDNLIQGNNKEGVCFDWGSALNVFIGNKVLNNGERARMSERDLKDDFIEAFPLLSDGSSSCKLPGLSLDNGVMNLIVANKFHRNFGGAVKMVRSALCNVLIDNFFTDNSLGRNPHFPRFNAVQHLAMGHGGGEFSPEAALLDFLPSNFNLCSGNTAVLSAPDKFIGSDKASRQNRALGNRVNIYARVDAE